MGKILAGWIVIVVIWENMVQRIFYAVTLITHRQFDNHYNY